MSGLDTEEVIVVVRHHGSFRWFKSDRDLWVLDWNKWDQVFVDAGYKVPEFEPSERFGIRVVNGETAHSFLSKMQPFEISKTILAMEFVTRFPNAQSWWDVGDLFPIMFVDFDRKHVCAFYPDGIRMERYLPDDWTGEFEDFATIYPEDLFPIREKFWVQDGLDLLKALNERARRLSRSQQ